MMGFRISSGTALICFSVLSIVSPVISEDTFNDLIQDTIDSLVQDMTAKYSTDFDSNTFWHPYVYGTGNENREVIHVEDVKKELIEGDYFQWKYARLGLKHYIIGLTRNSIDLFGSDFQKITSVETTDDLDALAVYTRWNDEHYHAELILLAVTSEPRLNVYLLEDNVVDVVGTFPLHYDVKGIELCHVGSSTKVVIIPKAEEVDIDIYNIEVGNSSTVWFFQRLPEAGSPNVVVFDSDMLESVIAVARDTKVEIYTFDSKAGLFEIYQSVNIPMPCRRLFSFTLSYQHYIGCIPLEYNAPVLFISYNYNTNEYGKELNTFGNITAVEVYPVAVADYRDEYLLIVQDNDGITHIMSYHGRQIGFQIEYSCSDPCPPIVDLNRGIGFRHKEYTAYVFPTSQGGHSSEVFLIQKQIRDSSSPLYAESRNLYNTFQELSKQFEVWERGVMGVQKKLENRVQSDQPNEITGSWDVESIETKHVEFKEDDYAKSYTTNTSESVFEEFRFMNAVWTDEDFSVDPVRTVKELKALQNDVSYAQMQLLDAVFESADYVQVVTAQQEVTGTFNSKYLNVQSIQTVTIQDYRNATAFLDSLAKKSSKLYISGVVVFNNPLTVTKLIADVINDVVVAEIAKSSEENVFTCTIQFANSFSVYGNVLPNTVNGYEIRNDLVTPKSIVGFEFTDGIVVQNNTRTSYGFDFNNVLLRSSEQVVSSPVFFNSVKITTPLTITLINGYNFYDFASSVISDNYSGEISGTKTVKETLEAEYLDITSMWNYVPFPTFFVYKTQKRVVITGRKNFTYINADKVTVGNYLDDLDPNTFVDLSSSMDLNGKWTFVGQVSIINDIWVGGTVDGVYMEDLKSNGTLDEYKESYTALADVEFEQEIQIDNLFIKSTINGDDFDQVFGNLLIFNGSYCKIPGTTTVESNLTVDSIYVDSGVINSYELSSFFNLAEEQNITGDIRLTGECQFNSLYALGKYDGVNLRELLSNAVRLTGVNKIEWKTHFDHIQCGAGMVADSPINYISDYGRSVAVISGREFQTFSSPITFDNAVFYNLEIEDEVYLPQGVKLAGVDVESWNSRRLSLSRDEKFEYRFEIEGLVKVSYDISVPNINGIPFSTLEESILRTDRPSQTFKNYVHTKGTLKVIDGQIRFNDAISGQSLDDLLEYAFPLNSNTEGWLVLDGTWHFQSIRVSENLTVTGSTCGIDLDYLNADSVRKSESDVEISGDNTFTSIKVEKDITAYSINNKMNFDKLFSLRDAQSIYCPFYFLKDVTVDGDLITDGQLNDISLSTLASSYTKDHENNVHIVQGDHYSDRNMTMDNLKVTGNIQDADFESQISKLVRTNDPNLSFTVLKTFKSPIVISGDADIYLYNGIDPKDLKLLRLDDNIVFDNQVGFTGPVEANAMSTYLEDVDPKYIVGIDWENLIRYAIPISDISPEQYLELDDILVQKYLNADLFQNKPFTEYITLTGEQSISQLRVYEAEIIGSNIPVNGLVSGVDLMDEFKNTLMKNANPSYNVEGKKIFKGTVIINGDFNCFGPEIQEGVIDISRDFNISSPVEFVNRLYVDGGVNVSEPVHGTTIESIVSEALTQEDDQPITAEWEFSGGVVFKEDVTGPGELENFDLQGLIDRKNAEIRDANERIARQKQIFQEACYNVYNLTEDLTSNPMKLDAFDSHQSILLRKQVEKVITVSAAGKLYLLTSSSYCEIVKYEWKLSKELFYKDIDTEQSQLRLGHVNEWESVSHGSTGILVFSNQIDDCSSLEIGLHTLLLDPSTGFSGVLTVLSGYVTAFKLVTDATTARTAIFVLKDPNVLQIWMWNEYEARFVYENEIPLEQPYVAIDLTLLGKGAGVLLSSKTETSVFHYSWATKSFVLIGKDYFPTDIGLPASLFESYDDLYAIVPEEMTQLSTLHSTCTVQIVKASSHETHQLQQLSIQDLVSHTVIPFSGQIYVTFLSKSFGLSVYKFMGLNGLQLLNENPIKVFNGLQVYSFEVRPWRFSAARPFLLILTGRTIEVFHSNVYGDSLNLSAKHLCRVS